MNGFLASHTWPFKDTTFYHEFAPLEAAAAIHDQPTAAADQPGAVVIYPEATAEQQAAVVENPEAVAGEPVDLEKPGFNVRIVGNGLTKYVHQTADCTPAIIATMNRGRPFVECCICQLTVCSFVESCTLSICLLIRRQLHTPFNYLFIR